MKIAIFVSSLLLVMSAILNAQETNTPTVKQRFVTVAGELKVVQLDEFILGKRFIITLNNDLVLETNADDETSRFDDFHVPYILKQSGFLDSRRTVRLRYQTKSVFVEGKIQ